MDARGKVLLGTCGWTDESLLRCGRFYPGHVRNNEDRLQHYATFFPCVEVDTSLYAVASPKNVEKWCGLVPKDFVFHFKAYGLFALQSMSIPSLPYVVKQILPPALASLGNVTLTALPDDCKAALWAHYNASLLPAYTAGKLGVVVFQFHVGFKPTEAHFEHIRECRRRLDSRYKMAVEFRDRAWLQMPEGSNVTAGDEDGRGSKGSQLTSTLDDTLAFLRSLSIIYIVADELYSEMPNAAQSGTSRDGVIPVRAGVASPACAYIRLHRRQGSDRLLGESEVRDWVARVAELSRNVDGPVYFLLSTAHEDQAIVNAKRLVASLKELAFDWPAHYRAWQQKRGGLLAFVSSAPKKKGGNVEESSGSGQREVGAAETAQDAETAETVESVVTSGNGSAREGEPSGGKRKMDVGDGESKDGESPKRARVGEGSPASRGASPKKALAQHAKGVRPITSFFGKGKE